LIGSSDENREHESPATVPGEREYTLSKESEILKQSRQPSIRSNTVSLADGKGERPNSLSTARRCDLFCSAELTRYSIGKGVA
jgi:hypothetical protein